MIRSIIVFLSAVVSLYSFICLVAILMTWIPGVKFTKFGRFISKMTDPYLDIFSRIQFLRIGGIDFSPIIAIGLLSLLSSILSMITASGRISLSITLVILLKALWEICSSILILFFIILLIRWIVLKVNKDKIDYNSIWYQVDIFFQKFVYKIAKPFIKNTNSYSKALLISCLEFFASIFVLRFTIALLIKFCQLIPF